MRRNRRILITMIVAIFSLAVLLSGIRPAAALPANPVTPPLPHQFNGRVTINGASVPLDAVVSAWCTGVQVKSSPVALYSSETWYLLDVPAEDQAKPGIDGCTSGQTINFKIGDIPADQTGTWVEGGLNNDFNLTASVERKIYLPLVNKP